METETPAAAAMLLILDMPFAPLEHVDLDGQIMTFHDIAIKSIRSYKTNQKIVAEIKLGHLGANRADRWQTGARVRACPDRLGIGLSCEPNHGTQKYEIVYTHADETVTRYSHLPCRMSPRTSDAQKCHVSIYCLTTKSFFDFQNSYSLRAAQRAV